jgi:isopentenyldiphosphate isomerase
VLGIHRLLRPAAAAINAEEIADWRWVSPEVLQEQMLTLRQSTRFTPWFKLEWARVWSDHRAAVLALRTR